jgi:hypothetical protein
MSDYGPLYAGLDPGASGGLGLLSADGQFQATYPWPDTEREIYDLLAEHAPFLRLACLEAASSRPGQGVATTFAFGRAYGLLRGFLVALEIPFSDVAPSQWTKGLGVHIKRGTTTYSQRKTYHRQRAQQWFPRLKVTNATADALLIAEYCRRCSTFDMFEDAEELVK